MPKVLQPLQRVTAALMTGNITSLPVDGRYLEQIKWFISFTGTPTGTFAIQESPDHKPEIDSTNGTWITDGTTVTAASGAPGSQVVVQQNQGPAFYRLVYTFSSGTGTLNVWASGGGPE